jgi:hypothetical protein
MRPGERIDLKKRIIATLAGQGWGDIQLTFDEFGFPELANFSGTTTADYVFERVSKADNDSLLLELDDYLHPGVKRPGDPPISELLQDRDNSAFSVDEQREISRLIADLKIQAKKTYLLSDQEIGLLEAKLDYLCDAATRTGRVDWLNLTCGAIGGAFAGGVLTPEVVHNVLHALATAVGHLFGVPLPQLPAA